MTEDTGPPRPAMPAVDSAMVEREHVASQQRRAATMPEDPAETVRKFDAAFNRHDLIALADLITDDCVFESTEPPDGHRDRSAVTAVSRFRLFGRPPEPDRPAPAPSRSPGARSA